MKAVDVVVRCRNEMPHLRRTLAALAAQEGVAPRVLFLDCESTDGSRGAAADFGVQIHEVKQAEYVPGAILNRAMAMTRSEVVAFVNGDAVPLDPFALAKLVEPLRSGGSELAATWARQVPRPDADRATRADYLRAFGDAPVPLRRGQFFSMAASAVRREAWTALPFDERVRYSEDADWTVRAAALGWRALYVPGARFEHSHRYALREHFRRRAGEGAADAAIHRLDGPSPVADLLRPLAGAVLRDVRSGGLRPGGVLVRAAQALGGFAGRRAASRSGGSGCDGPRLNVRRLRASPATAVRDPGLEARVAHEVELAGARIAEALGPRLRALLLVGSYGRGEGGALGKEGRLAPDNDYDLVAVVDGGARGLRPLLGETCARISASLRFDVEAWPIDAAELARLPPTLFWLDAARDGACLVRGDEATAARLRPITARQVPLDECGRLLANRAVGLALSNLEVAADPLRLARHAHKAVLACGDALLLAADRYLPRQEQRLRALEALQDAPAVGPELVSAYREALVFRARPDRWQPPRPLQQWYAGARDLVCRAHLAFESWRAGAPVDPLAFAGWRGTLYRRLPDVRSAALSAFGAALSGDAPLRPYLGHPRERLARAAVALAYGAGSEHRAAAARLLGAPDASAAELSRRLRTLAARAG